VLKQRVTQLPPSGQPEADRSEESRFGTACWMAIGQQIPGDLVVVDQRQIGSR
jgi:hypothetical protein